MKHNVQDSMDALDYVPWSSALHVTFDLDLYLDTFARIASFQGQWVYETSHSFWHSTIENSNLKPRNTSGNFIPSNQNICGKIVAPLEWCMLGRECFGSSTSIKESIVICVFVFTFSCTVKFPQRVTYRELYWRYFGSFY